MNIQQCKYVVAIATFGSFNEAAKQLYVSQPSLSSAVKDLEAELTTQLFIRSKAGVTLTEAGVDFLCYAKNILAQVDLVEKRHQKQTTNLQRFSVSAQHYDFLSKVLIKLLNEYEDSCPYFRLNETTTLSILEDVKEFRSELGILFLDDENSKVIERYLQNEQLVFEPLADYQTQIFLRREHPLADQAVISLNQLTEYPQIRFAQENDGCHYFEEDPLQIHQERAVIYTNDRGTLMNLLHESDAYASGLGIIDGFIQEKIVLRALSGAKQHTLGVIRSEKRKTTELATRFVQLVKAALYENQVSIGKSNNRS